MKKNIALTIAYDGTSFYGWQETKEGPSIEGHLKEALERILQHPVELQAASRTDRGVHAQGQVVNFFTPKELSLLSINALLPKEIRVCDLKEENDAFHPTLDAVGKEYHYRICLGPVQQPSLRQISWHVPHKLDVEKMKKAAKYLEGTHDFSAFCTGERRFDATRTLDKVSIFEDKDGLLIVVRGDSFLYKMVRTLVGTLVHIGRGKIENIEQVLQSKERVEAGEAAPAHGLVLKKVFYDRTQ